MINFVVLLCKEVCTLYSIIALSFVFVSDFCLLKRAKKIPDPGDAWGMV